MSNVDPKVLEFVQKLAATVKRGYRGCSQEVAYENGNFDDAWQGGYNCAEWDLACEACEVLGLEVPDDPDADEDEA